MNQYIVHLLDLPNEILFIILKKLENVDVLYSLLGINNQRLEIIAQEQIFTNILNFVSKSQSTDEISSISSTILDRFCISILPRIHKNIKSLIIESVSMEEILRVGNYPNLTKLKIFNFNKLIVSKYFKDDSLSRHIDKQQITDLVLVSNENNIEITQKEYTKNVYAIIFDFFKNLKHLSIVPSSINDYPPLSLYISPPLVFSSSTLTKLCININDFNDCLALLDGRFKQLNTFIVQIEYTYYYSISTISNTNDHPNLKCFSLTCYPSSKAYDNLVVPLLRRMSNLEELSLYIHIFCGSLFISGTHLHNEILIYMPQLHTFTFCITSENYFIDPPIRISNLDIERTFTNIKCGQVACMVDYFETDKTICRVFSLPFKFHCLKQISNNIPNLVFNSVTHLELWDENAFKYEFFIRLQRGFPFLKSLSIWNIRPPFWGFDLCDLNDKDWCSIIEYPHLISLNIASVNIYYVEHFLNETKTHLPRLTELKIRYNDLEMVTKNFTRDETRRNCAKVNRLIVEHSIVYPKDVYYYFPLLSV
ncbi:unnamed protein product [Rotaria sp. Silwood2]|nr:unnamed protein product [Rotaria sp. Silwood2]CAF2796455.1 unnamed protein product [Rotaria sp. Silwood2]CAF3007990.1 unnamed protein product [Rotaria sp. Silwood2]CAF3163278.1 unnamed protein product [Rotaria sp. Silwood2]CAF4119119.1 unnamed protein product [Rotaria sp. Silwood2]